MERCDYCGRRFDRPSENCTYKDKHSAPDLAQAIVELIETDLRGRKGLGNEFEQIDRDIQEEIRDEWAVLISDELHKP